MKYLVNRETKEHKVATTLAESIIKGYPDFKDDWQLVEADAEGWIPWEGGDCPLPGWCECEIQTKEGDRLLSREAKRWTWSPNIGDATITHYRPILAEKEEPESRVGAAMEGFVSAINGCASRLDTESVFDRLRNATEAAESIPAILEEINALLPDGYCVTNREAEKVEQFAEDMSDWRNWREGDLVRAISTSAGGEYVDGMVYKIKRFSHDIIYTERDELRSVKNGWGARFFRFHSRPAKVAE